MAPFPHLSCNDPSINGIEMCHAFISHSAVFPKATEQPADACRNQYGHERPLPDKLLADARGTVDFFLPLSTVFRRFFAHPPELLLGSIPYGPAHFLQVFSYFFRLFAKLITCGRHVFSSSIKKHEIARRGATGED
jgi:hypothetical protein